MKISTQNFDYIRQSCERYAGITIDEGKEYLVESRLGPKAREWGFSSIDAIIAEMKRPGSQDSLQANVVEALTVNETAFFRDGHPFEYMKNRLIPQAIEANRNRRKLSIWSAACSTGQEIYSIAILLNEHFPELENWDITLFATDLSHTVIKQARKGIYSSFEVNRGLNQSLQAKYFDSHVEELQLKQPIRSSVRFEACNLISSWGQIGTFDIILLRNVMIYFDLKTKQRILHNIKKHLLPKGHLLLGAAETTYNIDPDWISQRAFDSTSYQLKSS